MSTEVSVANGRLLITDDGATVMDSNQELLHHISNVITGVVSRPSFAVGGPSRPSGNARFETVDLGALPAGTQTIQGLHKITYGTAAGASPILPSGWYVAGGSTLLVHKVFQGVGGTHDLYPTSVMAVTLYQDAGRLKFLEEFVHKDDRDAALGVSFKSYTVDYRIFPGAFN